MRDDEKLAFDVLRRFLDWQVTDDRGEPIEDPERRELIRFGRATTFVAETSFLRDEDRLGWYGWLQNAANERGVSRAVRDQMRRVWNRATPAAGERVGGRPLPDLDPVTRRIRDVENVRTRGDADSR